jgi:hypothetical protein
MGLGATLTRIDGEPLGPREELVRIFEENFPGIAFRWTPSGPEKIAFAKSRGWEYPPILREHFEQARPVFEGNWDGPDGSMRLFWDGENSAAALDLDFRGSWDRSDAIWAEVLPLYGWQIEYHSTLIPPGQAIRRG